MLSINLMRILKQILCWPHLLLLAVFVCISMISVSTICQAINETHNVTGDMPIFAARVNIPNNNNIKKQVPRRQSYDYQNYRILIIVGITIFLIVTCFCFCDSFGCIIIRFIRNISNTIRDTFDNLRRLISYVNIRNVFIPLVNEDELQINYVNRAFEDDSVINNMEEPQDEQ